MHSNDSVSIPPHIPFADVLALETYGKEGIADPFEKRIVDLLRKGNLAHAETLLRMSLEREPINPKALNFLGWIAEAINLPQFAAHYFSEASRLAPEGKMQWRHLERTRKYSKEDRDVPTIEGLGTGDVDETEKFLLIRAWGYGFWSDVSHVLSQLLVAEISGRIPIVHWGANSLFSDGTGSNAFEFYFNAPSNVGVGDLQKENVSFWPPKWNHRNLTDGEINKWAGPYSRMAGLYLLSRPERVVVSDFHTPLIDLKPWIPIDHHLYGLSIDELYFYLVRQYLHPRGEILDEVDSFYKEHLASSDFIAVHARGSDKVVELKNLDDVNRQYKLVIDRYLSIYDCNRIFLMTDDSRILDHFVGLYGSSIVTTDCQRTSSLQGIHYQAVPDRRRLGAEVMKDVYLAAKAKVFIGNGFSNPSLITQYLKNWPEGDLYLIGRSMYHAFNTSLHTVLGPYETSQGSASQST